MEKTLIWRENGSKQGIKTLRIGDAIVILTRVKFAVLKLVIPVTFSSLVIKLFFKAKAAKKAG